MTTQKRLLIFNILALVCAMWFLALGWVWVYFFNVIVVFPFAILGFFLWRKGREAENKILNRIVGWMLLAGLIAAIGILVAYLLYN